jgi:hypothetical protein
LIIRDFNLHYTFWGKRTVSRSYAEAALVVEYLCTQQLDLLLKPRTITKEKYYNKLLTLNLTLSTLNLTPWVMSCKVANTYVGSNCYNHMLYEEA